MCGIAGYSLSPELTVDSEAIFALVDAFGAQREALEQLRGAMATSWLDERRPNRLYAGRGVGRPLWLGHGRHELFFASTKEALELVERTLVLKLRKREVPEGALAAVEEGKVVARLRFATHPYVEDDPLPAVRAPQEALAALQALAGLYAA